MRSKHESMCNRHHTNNINKTHSTNLKKINPNHIRTSHFSNLNKISKNKKSRAIIMKYFEKNRKSIPFLEVWRRDDDENGGILRETRWVCEREMNGQDNEQLKWTRENKKFLKTILKAQNTRFLWLRWVTNKSPNQVTKTHVKKFWKTCLSVFCNWKVHPQGIHEGSHGSFWVNLTNGASTREQVAKLSGEKSKSLDFWKIF